MPEDFFTSQNLLALAVTAIALAAIGTAVVLVSWAFAKRKVKAESARYAALVQVNERYKYAFDRLLASYGLEEKCKSLAKFEQFDPRNMLLESMQQDRIFFEEKVRSAEHNKKTWEGYLRDVEVLPEPSFSEFFLKHVEEGMVEKAKRWKPRTDFRIVVSYSYTSPAGRNSYRNERVFSYEEVKALMEESARIVRERNARQQQIKRERAKVTPGVRYDVFLRDHFRCVICGSAQSDGVKLHVDHIIPVSKGGTSDMSNLRTLCDRCNMGKRDKIE